MKDNSGRLSTKFEQASLQTKQNYANLIGPSTAGFLDTKGAIKTFPPWYKGGFDRPPLLGFRYITIFRKDFTLSRKPVMCSTR